jgi:hypothetical protein
MSYMIGMIAEAAFAPPLWFWRMAAISRGWVTSLAPVEEGVARWLKQG